jgi:Rad3-related DNA helicase
LTIEELGTLYEEKKMCPYYDQKGNMQSADIIFMPYNYLISNEIRERV